MRHRCNNWFVPQKTGRVLNKGSAIVATQRATGRAPGESSRHDTKRLYQKICSRIENPTMYDRITRVTGRVEKLDVRTFFACEIRQLPARHVRHRDVRPIL